MDSSADDAYRFKLRRAMQTLHEANVAVYALDPRGHVTEQELIAECFPAPAQTADNLGFDRCPGTSWGPFAEDATVRRYQKGLDLFSETSGGFAIVNREDFDRGIDQIVDALDNYYVLGFYPTKPKGSTFGPLRVTVGRGDLVVRYRRGYVPAKKPKPPTRPDPAGELLAGVLPATAYVTALAEGDSVRYHMDSEGCCRPGRTRSARQS